MKKIMPIQQRGELLAVLEERFAKNPHRHPMIVWPDVEARLSDHTGKLWTLREMEDSGGEPDVVGCDPESGEFIFCDCSAESPRGRRSLCYDRGALDARKTHKPANSALELAASMGIELLDEEQYLRLQAVQKCDTKTSSWLKTPPEVRQLGGALFGDFRYGRVFIYHNGADSYFGARGFRGILRV